MKRNKIRACGQNNRKITTLAALCNKHHYTHTSLQRMKWAHDCTRRVQNFTRYVLSPSDYSYVLVEIQKVTTRSKLPPMAWPPQLTSSEFSALFTNQYPAVPSIPDAFSFNTVPPHSTYFTLLATPTNLNQC